MRFRSPASVIADSAHLRCVTIPVNRVNHAINIINCVLLASSFAAFGLLCVPQQDFQSIDRLFQRSPATTLVAPMTWCPFFQGPQLLSSFLQQQPDVCQAGSKAFLGCSYHSRLLDVPKPSTRDSKS
jgi:hypothetical protein